MKVHVGEVPDVKPVFAAVAYQLCDVPVLVTADLQPGHLKHLSLNHIPDELDVR